MKGQGSVSVDRAIATSELARLSPGPALYMQSTHPCVIMADRSAQDCAGDAEVVAAVKSSSFGSTDVNALADNASHMIEKLVHMAGSIASGPRYTESRIALERLKVRTSALCNKSILTISKLKETCTTVSAEITLVRDGIISRGEVGAESVKRLSLFSKTAECMEKAAGELCSGFLKVQESIEHLLRLYEKIYSSILMIENGDEDGQSIKELSSAIRAVKELSAVIIEAWQFWSQMQEHCKSLADETITRIIEKALTYPEDKRCKLWATKGFKVKMSHFCAGWVVMNNVCGDYIDHVKFLQPKLHKDLTDNPENLCDIEKCLSELKLHQNSTQSSSSTKAGNTLNPKNLPTALKLLQPVAAEWQNIGCLLEIPPGTLDSIRYDEQGKSSNCLRRMLSVWLVQTDPPPTWTSLAEAVDTYNPAVAEEIKEKFSFS